MADLCYYKGKKVILVPGRKGHQKWVCQYTIPEFKESEIDKYRGHPPGEYETEQEAKMAAFAYSKKILDSLD